MVRNGGVEQEQPSNMVGRRKADLRFFENARQDVLFFRERRRFFRVRSSERRADGIGGHGVYDRLHVSRRGNGVAHKIRFASAARRLNAYGDARLLYGV